MKLPTREKRKRIEDRRPPAEIREKTKERRAWLAEELVKVNATPGLMGKIMGLGSYQVVGVYEVTQLPGREQKRGICAGCGSSVALPDGGGMLTSLHGYERPGDGYAHGQCVGAKKVPANVSTDLTLDIIAKMRADIIDLKAYEMEWVKKQKGVSFDSSLFQTNREEAMRLSDEGRFYEHEASKCRHMIWTNEQWIRHLLATAIPALNKPLTVVVL